MCKSSMKLPSTSSILKYISFLSIFTLYVSDSAANIYSCLESNTPPLYTVDDFKFCQCCPPGFYKKDDCSATGEKAVCMPCESGYYSNTPNQAIGCSLCYHPPKCSRPNIEMTQNCNLTTNFDCRCKDGFYFKLRPGSNGDGDCKKHSSCPQGMYMEQKGTSEIDTLCKPCENVSQTDSEDYNISCINQGKDEEECDPTSDTTCPKDEKELIEQQSKDITIGIITAVVVIAILITASVVLYCLRKHNVVDIFSLWKKDKQNSDSEGFDSANNGTIYIIPNGTEGRALDSLNIPIPEVIPTLKGSPVDGSFDFDYVAMPITIYPNAETRKQWMDCLRWMSHIVNVTSWKFVIRHLISQIDADRNGDCIIQEVVVNYRDDVREQIYNALLKWYQMTGPENVDLLAICEALEEKGEGGLAQKLKEKYPDLVRRNSKSPSIEYSISNTWHEDGYVNEDMSSKYGVDEEVNV